MPTSISSPAGTNLFRRRASLASAAALGAVVAPSLAKAQVVWSGTLDKTIGGSVVLLDFNQNDVADSNEAYLQISGGKGGTHVEIESVGSGSTAFLYDPTSVAVGSTIGSLLSYSTAPTAFSGSVLTIPSTGTPEYFAFAVQTTDGPDYGWMEVSFNGTTGTLDQWAHNGVPDSSITAGQISAIPEPALTVPICGAAALLFACWHRRRFRIA
jgi:hypothetical protein